MAWSCANVVFHCNDTAVDDNDDNAVVTAVSHFGRKLTMLL